MNKNYPRIVIGGMSGDSGKTIVSCGIISCLRKRGKNVSAFKKGPDYIDSAWLSLVSGKPARNLDSYLMGFPVAKKSFLSNAEESDISVIEGNRGLFDGVDKKGTHSTAELAKLLQAPVIIIQNISKVTRTAATSILGCMKLDPGVQLKGVILNKVSGDRHKKVVTEAIEEITGLPVLGCLPKLSNEQILPSRYLGLITPEESDKSNKWISDLGKIIEENIDINKIIEIADNSLALVDDKIDSDDYQVTKTKVKIGYFKDLAFSFYYEDNLEALVSLGAELIPISAFGSGNLKNLDALYIGGGFPEKYLANLSLNKNMMSSVKELAEDGLPIYAECGGLMYLAKDIDYNNQIYSFSGVLPIRIKMFDKPQGHGYCHAIVENKNPYFKKGTILKGHEFHYSKIYEYENNLKTCLSITRGVGCFNERDGLIYKNVFASYIHIHALATPQWANGFINCAKSYRDLKESKILVEG